MRVDDGKSETDRSMGDGLSDQAESRRRLLKAGLVAVPFLVTLHALPARAGGQAQGSLGMYGSGGQGTGGAGGGGGDQTRGGGRRRVTQTGD